MKTKSKFVNHVIGTLVDTSNTIKRLEMPTHLAAREIQEACVYWLYKINQINQEDHATCVGTVELTEALYNLICTAQLLSKSADTDRVFKRVDATINKLAEMYS